MVGYLYGPLLTLHLCNETGRTVTTESLPKQQEEMMESGFLTSSLKCSRSKKTESLTLNCLSWLNEDAGPE